MQNLSNEIKQCLQPGKKNIILIYALFLAGIMFPVLPLIGAAFAYANKAHTSNLYQSHYIFAFRTFCFGVIGFFISFIATFVFIGPLIYIVVLVWFMARNIIALQLLVQRQPIPNPLTLWLK